MAFQPLFIRGWKQLSAYRKIMFLWVGLRNSKYLCREILNSKNN